MSYSFVKESALYSNFKLISAPSTCTLTMGGSSKCNILLKNASSIVDSYIDMRGSSGVTFINSNAIDVYIANNELSNVVGVDKNTCHNIQPGGDCQITLDFAHTFEYQGLDGAPDTMTLTFSGETFANSVTGVYPDDQTQFVVNFTPSW